MKPQEYRMFEDLTDWTGIS